MEELTSAVTNVMRSPIPVRAYVDDAILELERKQIFESLWIFVGLAHLLDEENAFITRSVGEVPVLIQRMGGRLRAFQNRCLHRGMALQTEAVGNRALTCKYHGWAYAEDGRVRGTPNPQIYEFTAQERSGMCLREFGLRRVGNLLFVCVGDEPPSFESQFDAEFIDCMAGPSLKFDWEVAYAEFEVAWNWKLNFENVLDWNHIQFIHPKSFFPLMDPLGERGISISSNARALLEEMRRNESVTLPSLSYSVHGPMATGPNPWGDHVDRYGDLDDYYNWFIFPNVNFCSVHGKMFLIQQFVPKTPSTTAYHLWVMTARRTQETANYSGLLWSLIKGEKAVVDEDAVVLSALQSKLSASAERFRHGAYEAHIVRWHRWYVDQLGLSGAD